MNLLLQTFAVVLLGSFVLAPCRSESIQLAENEQDAGDSHGTGDGKVDAVLQDVGMDSFDVKRVETNKKREIDSRSNNGRRHRVKKSASSIDADDCNAQPLPLSDIDKQRLLVEVLNAGQSAHDAPLGDQRLTFENRHGCAVSRQTSTGTRDCHDAVTVVHVDAGGKELVNESVHFENNRPKSVVVETADRIVVHDLGSSSNVTSEVRGTESKPRPFVTAQVKTVATNASSVTSPQQLANQHGAVCQPVKDEDQQRQAKNDTSLRKVDANPSNTRPLTLENFKNQPSSLRKSVKASCAAATAGPAQGEVRTEVQPRPRQDAHHPEGAEASDVLRTPSHPSLFDTSANLLQYRLAPWGVVEPRRFSASNAPRPRNNLLPSLLAQSIVMSPSVALPNAARVGGDPAKRADVGGGVTLIVLQPEAVSVDVPERGPMVVLPERVVADRRYVLVPAEDFLIAAPEALESRAETRPDKEAGNKYAYARHPAGRRPDDIGLLNENAARGGSSKKAVQDMTSSQERFESKCHEADADSDIFNVGAVGTCCGPDCHCTCNLGPGRRPVGAPLLPSTTSRRHFAPDPQAPSRTARLESPSERSQERRWPAGKLARMKSSAGQDAGRLAPVLGKCAGDHSYPKRTQMMVRDYALPQRTGALMGKVDDDLGRMAPMEGRRPQTHETGFDAWDVYQEIPGRVPGPRYKREDDGKGESEAEVNV